MKGDYYMLEYMSIRFKWDDKAAWFLTIDRGEEDLDMLHEPIMGMCGNLNWDVTDDFLMNNGKTARDPGEFGNSWHMNKAGMEVGGPRIISNLTSL